MELPLRPGILILEELRSRDSDQNSESKFETPHQSSHQVLRPGRRRLLRFWSARNMSSQSTSPATWQALGALASRRRVEQPPSCNKPAGRRRSQGEKNDCSWPVAPPLGLSEE